MGNSRGDVTLSKVGPGVRLGVRSTCSSEAPGEGKQGGKAYEGQGNRILVLHISIRVESMQGPGVSGAW
jgi:hypothetical protein